MKRQAAKTERRTARKKPSAADFLASPPEAPPKSPADENNNNNDNTPKCFKFNINSSPPEKTSAPGSNRRKSAPAKVNPPSPRRPEAVSSLSELKELTASRLESIKRQTERSHSDILKEIDSSNSRLHKRFKIQTQACQKLMDESDKEFKKMLERINESCEAMKVSFAEFQVEAQTTHSRVCKTSIPEKGQYFENAIDALRNRYVTA